jgi:hypothetical protein
MHGIQPHNLTNEELLRYAELLDTTDAAVTRQWIDELAKRLAAQLDDNK